MKIFLGIACALLPLAGVRAQDTKYNAFVRNLTKAIDYSDEKGLERLVRSSPDLAVRHFSITCWEWKAKQEDAKRRVLDAMRGAWERVFRSGTLEKYERYILAQTEKTRLELYKLDVAFNKLLKALGEAERSKRRSDFEMCRESGMKLAQAAEHLGHPLLAAK